MRSHLTALALGLALAGPAAAQEPVEYLVRVDDPTTSLFHVEASVPATGATTLVSLPAWTPGHYTTLNYARYVRRFAATDPSGAPLDWDKVDKDTWRIASEGADRVRVAFDFLADTINLSGSLLKPDFGFFNGTNLFVYPETGYDFASRVRFELPDGWRIATELDETGTAGIYRADDYHELVDNPTFVGHFAIDSVAVDDVWMRVAMYPGDRLQTPLGQSTLEAMERLGGAVHDLFGGPPYDRYTTLVYLETGELSWAGGLEHADSHLDILPAQVFDAPPNPAISGIYQALLSHELYHAWNVKRIRPAEMWPYAYDREQPTALLWVSEGITDYYADLLLSRAGLWDEATFWGAIGQSIQQVEDQPAQAAVEDTSFDAWIDPTWIASNYYYHKGKAIGLLLDVMIREATGGERSLDDVMRRLYRDHYEAGRGFTTDDLLGYLAEHVGEDEARAFHERHIDGREPLPYATGLRPAGMAFRTETVVEPFLGLGLAPGEDGYVVAAVTPGGAAEAAGLEEGDVVSRVGEVEVAAPDWGDAYRGTYADRVGEPLTIVFRRGGAERTGETTVRTRTRMVVTIEPDPAATDAQRRLRAALLGG